MSADREIFRVVLLAGAAALFAACGGGDRQDAPAGEETAAGGTDAAAEAEDAAPPPAPASGDVAEGDWFYKESNGYPWAGYGPPRSEAFFVIACEDGRLSLQRAGGRDPAAGDERFTVRFKEGEEDIVMADAGTELPMMTVSLSPDARLAGMLLETRAPFAIEGGARALILPPDDSYRRVIRSCRGA